MAFREGDSRNEAFAAKLRAGHLGIYGTPTTPTKPEEGDMDFAAFKTYMDAVVSDVKDIREQLCGMKQRDRGQFGLGGASATTGTFRIGRKVRWRWDGKHTSIQELRSIAANSPNLRWWRNCPLARWFGWGTSQWRSLPPTSWRCGRRWVTRCSARACSNWSIVFEQE